MNIFIVTFGSRGDVQPYVALGKGLKAAGFPIPGMPQLNLGGAYNKLTYKTIPMGFRMYTGMTNEIRQEEMGLDKFPKGTGLYRTAGGAPIPVLLAFSSHVVPRPADWPDYATIPGYWFLERQDDWQPDPELEAFLAAGDAPIYVGFGSMAGKDPARLANIVIDALQRANLRGVLASGWGGLEAGDLPGTIFQIERAPHDWLFPRMSAVVHRGGAGTTAAGLRAGKPSVICPFMGDQPFWGSRVHALGAGPQPIPQKKLTAENLAQALQVAAKDITVRKKAEALGEQIRGEDGIANAVAAIEGILRVG